MRTKVKYPGWFAALFALLPAAALMNAGEPNRLPATNLMVFHDAAGQTRPVKSAGDWQLRRAEILRGMQQIMGPLPGNEKRCPLDPQVLGETNRGAYQLQELTYAAEPGGRVPALLLLPHGASAAHPAPAVLALHPTEMRLGRRVTVDPLRTTYRAYAHDLAERGFVVLAPAYPIMADYQPDLKALGYRSGTMKAIWDNLRGVDLLVSRPEVRPGAVGAIGHSLGGHNAIFTAVFDERLRAVVSSCGFDSFRVYQGGDLHGWTSERYLPALLEYRERLAEIPFDFYELLGALAPRPLFINAPLEDANFNHASVDAIVRAARPVYQLLGRPDGITLEHPAGGHDFPSPTRERAYEFLERALRATPGTNAAR